MHKILSHIVHQTHLLSMLSRDQLLCSTLISFQIPKSKAVRMVKVLNLVMRKWQNLDSRVQGLWTAKLLRQPNNQRPIALHRTSQPRALYSRLCFQWVLLLSNLCRWSTHRKILTYNLPTRMLSSPWIRCCNRTNKTAKIWASQFQQLIQPKTALVAVK